MDLHTWLIYLLAAIGLSLSPGPNGLLALTHGALHGRRKALFTVQPQGAAFLPQFIDPARSLLIQFAIMTGRFAAIEIATEVFIASLAHRISPWLGRMGRRFNRACGGVFVTLGAALPLRS